MRLCARAVSRPALLMSSRSRQPRACRAVPVEVWRLRAATGGGAVCVWKFHGARGGDPDRACRVRSPLPAVSRARAPPSSAQRDRISNLSNCISLYLYLCVTCVQRSIDDYFTDM